MGQPMHLILAKLITLPWALATLPYRMTKRAAKATCKAAYREYRWRAHKGVVKHP
jgi:hypothetical protein